MFNQKLNYRFDVIFQFILIQKFPHLKLRFFKPSLALIQGWSKEIAPLDKVP